MSLRQRFAFTQEPLYLMDGSAFVYRGYYAFQNMARGDGFPTNALYIVSRLVLKLLREEKPLFFSFILDGKDPTFRNTLYPSYKAQRSAMPEPLALQFPPIERLLQLLGTSLVVAEGFEADDYIACLANTFKHERPVVIIGADKDLRQCLDTSVVLWDPSGKDERITTLEDFVQATGMQPSSWPDYQALVGDSSDNIPGVPQVGPKTATGLIQQFPTLETLFSSLALLPQKIRAKLAPMQETCFLYRELTRLRTDACNSISLDELRVRVPDMQGLHKLLDEYEMRSLTRELASMSRAGCFSLGRVSSESGLLEKGKLLGGAESSRMTPQTVEKGSMPEIGARKAIRLPLLQNKEIAGTTSVVQGNLFDFSQNLTALLEYSTVKSLPALGNKLVILSHERGVLLASSSWQCLYTGPIHELATFLLSREVQVQTADCKACLSRYPQLWQINIARWFDISLAAYLLSPEERVYDFIHLARRYGDVCGSSFDEQATPGLLALDIAEYLFESLHGLSLFPVYAELEMPLIPVLARMEARGIRLDQGAFTDFLVEVQHALEALTQKIYAQATRSFNIRSSQQLADVLFGVLHLPTAGKTKKGASSTSQEALEKLRDKHQIIPLLLEYRTLEKLRSTYLEPLPRLVDTLGRLHTTFNQMATATGRLSSSNPNLQNIPVRGSFGKRMRRCFVADPGNLLVSADYSQIELRVLAHLSQDPTLLRAFQENEDIHSRTAGLLFDVSLEAVTPEQRRSAKTINFGLIYGMGAQKLAGELHLSIKEAKAFIERYFSRFSKLKEFYDSVEQEARSLGYVATMAGRRRLTPDLVSNNNLLRSQARRQAINTRIQGSAADIIKLAMLAVENDMVLKKLKATLLLQIHDELLIEVPQAFAEEAARRLTLLMEDVRPGGQPLSVPLLVDAGIGMNWAEAH